MRNHWTPRYLFDRAANLLYQKLHPTYPWLTPAAIRLLAGSLDFHSWGLEFGSGRSTVWLARRVKRLFSVEHNPEWHEKVKKNLEFYAIGNVDYHLAPREPEGSTGTPAYVRLAGELPDRELDFVLVDGIYRDQCVLACLPKLRSGGLLVIDNVNRYLPSRTRAPHSRTPADGPDGPGWGQVAEQLKDWRLFWTSNGVFDTAIYFKP
jgi:predicted O-methyltransferase YrrM